MNDWDEFMNKDPVESDRFSGMDRSQKLKDFTVTCDATAAQLAGVRNALGDIYRRGGTFEDFKKAVKEGDFGGVCALPSYRLENIFRTNVMEAYGRGRYMEQEEDANVFPYLLYVAVQDSRTRQSHMALNGIIVRFGSEEANLIYPPNGYQCRCSMRAMTKMEADAMGGPTPLAEVKRRIAENPPAKGFEGAPYAAAPAMPGTVPPGMPPEATAAAKRIADDLAASQAPLAPPADPAGAGSPALPGPPATPDALDVPDYLDPVEAEKYREVQRDMLEAFGNMLKNEKPPVSMGSQKDLDDYLNGLMLGVYGDMEGGASYTPKQREEYYTRADKRGRILEWAAQRAAANQKRQPPSKHFVASSELFSADVTKFLSAAQARMVSFHTSGGDRHGMNVFVHKEIDGRPVSPKMMARMEEFYRAQTLVHDMLNANVKRKKIESYRGVRNYEDLDKTTTLIDFLRGKAQGHGDPVGKTFKLRQAASFAEKLDKAEEFRGDRNGVIIDVVSAKGVPIRAVSLWPNEAEHLFANGSVFKVKKVWKEKVDSSGGKLDNCWRVEVDLVEGVLDGDITFSPGAFPASGASSTR